MMEEKKMQVVIDHQESVGDASPTILFTFTMLTMMFLALGTGYIHGEALLLLGCVQIGVYPVYIYCAKNAIDQKQTLSGNCYLIFASLFGGAAGLCNLATYFAGIMGWPLDGRLIGIVWIWSGLMLIPVVAAMRKGPWIPFVVFAAGGIMLVLFGISALGYASFLLNPIVAVMQAVVGIGGFYVFLANMFALGEISLPLGKTIF